MNTPIPTGVEQPSPSPAIECFGWSQKNTRERLFQQTETTRRNRLIYESMLACRAKRMAELTRPSLPAGRRLTHQYHPYRKSQYMASINNRGRLVEETETMRRNLLNHEKMVAHAKRTAELYAKRRSDVAELIKSSLLAAAAAQVEIPRPELVSHFRNLSLDRPTTTSSAPVAIPRPELDSHFRNLSLNHPSSPDETAV